MAKQEIEESDLLNLQHISSVVDQLMKAPETRAPFLRLAKAANPRLSIPEVDAAAPVIGAVNAVNKKLDDFIAGQVTRDQEAREREQINALKGAWADDEAQLRSEGWRTAGIEQARKFAEDNGISNLRIAADAFERRNPQPDPAQSRAGGWNLFAGPEAEDTFIKDMMTSGGENESRLDAEIRQTLADVRSGN